MNLFGISHCHFQVSLDGHRGSGDLLVIDPIVFLEAQEHCNDSVEMGSSELKYR